MDGNAEKSSFPMRSALVGNANMAIRREAFDRFGYFDTRMGRGTRIGSGEEPDFLLRILLGGAKIVVEPAARILHRHSTEWRAVRRWAFQSGCAHTAILTKYFLQESLAAGPDSPLRCLAPAAATHAGSVASSETQAPTNSILARQPLRSPCVPAGKKRCEHAWHRGGNGPVTPLPEEKTKNQFEAYPWLLAMVVLVSRVLTTGPLYFIDGPEHVDAALTRTYIVQPPGYWLFNRTIAFFPEP